LLWWNLRDREMIMSSQPETFLTVEEYLAIERKAEYRSEFFDGEMIAMTGASRKHNLIVANLIGELRQQLKGKPCELYANDMRVRIPSARIYTYPDVALVCGEPQFEDEYLDTLLNPTLIIEVLSDSTESYDRGKKFGYYRTINSLLEYLLVAQGEYKIEQYVRQDDGRWLFSEASNIDGTILLGSVECLIALKEIYERVEPE
jgi:Uma2 family endonuclease